MKALLGDPIGRSTMPELVHPTASIKKEETKVTIETGQGLNSMQGIVGSCPPSSQMGTCYAGNFKIVHDRYIQCTGATVVNSAGQIGQPVPDSLRL